MAGELSSPVLQRMVQRVATPDDLQLQCCEMCAEPIEDRHRHLLDLATAELLCACRPCSILFDHQAAGGQHYQLIPGRRKKLTQFQLDPPLWASLGVPVDLAFFVRDSGSGQVHARYPSVAGALRSPVPDDSWDRVVEANPVLDDLHTDVEALVVNRARGSGQYWILPLDECYRLTALLRQHWVGFSGGDQVWEEIDAFFAEIREVR